MNTPRRVLAALATSVVMGAGVLAGAPAAQACGAGEDCSSSGGSGNGSRSNQVSDGTRSAQYNSAQRTCSVYANGGSMGSYCVTPGGITTKTLRERFGDQKLQLCRYEEIPAGIPQPYNANPDEGRYMLMTCLSGINFDTFAGGNDRRFNISIVFVPNGTDTDDVHNGITDFLWNQIDKVAKMPVPIMQTKPNPTPVVGVPTFFTFKWIDPTSKNVVAQGPYAGRANGGPYVSIRSREFVMRAEASKVIVDANQKDMKPVTCGPSTPYTPNVRAAQQPAGACSLTFDRSSASARKLATQAIPGNVKDAFYASVEVTWRVTYGVPGGDMRDLGDFTMRLNQILPVQEIQTPNQPPTVIY